MLLLALQLTNINFAVGVLLLLMMMMMRFCNDDGFWLAWFLPYTPDLKKVHQGLRVNGGELAIQENESQLFMDLNPFLVKRNSIEHYFQASFNLKSKSNVMTSILCQHVIRKGLIKILISNKSVLQKERSKEYYVDDKNNSYFIFPQ